MKCFFCKGELTNKATAFMAETSAGLIVTKDVPSHVCSQCGEVSYTPEAAQELEQIVDSINTTARAPAEISVINYLEKVV